MTSRSIPPLTASDDELRTALADAHIPSLLPTLAQLTGDMTLLDPRFQPTGEIFAENRDQGGLSLELQAEARELAFQALKRYRDAGGKPGPAPSNDEVRQAIAWMTRGGSTEEYVPLLVEELAFVSEDPRAPKWKKAEIAPDRPFKVAIIGAGMSGIAVAHRLDQAGVDFTIIEKNSDVGGTWFENTYPGARVDNPNHSYSYSFRQKTDWPYHYSTQGVLLDYFRECADEFGLRPRIRFNTEVESATFDEGTNAWTLKLRTPSGPETIEANAVVSAVGQLNRPKMPDIKGMSTFEGPSFHSARWDHSVDLKGKRVIVIGTGASASQFIPHVANDAAELTIFQRTPNWYAPNPNYHAEVPEGLQWLFRHVPAYHQWYRFWLFWQGSDGLLPAAKADEGWNGDEKYIGAMNEGVRLLFTAYLQESFADRPDLLAKVVPSYPPASKRIVIDNGIWAETLKRPNVTLLTDSIKEISPRGVVTEDGTEHPADVIIYGTGFQASHFLSPMKFTGAGGLDLNEQWHGDARAYLGITVPNFPNLFLMYGPNTNIVVNGSIIYFSECETNYIVESVRELLTAGKGAMDCKPEVHDEYNVRVDAGNRQMAWGLSKVNSWYKNEHGHVAQNWPFSLLEYWQQTRKVNREDYAWR